MTDVEIPSPLARLSVTRYEWWGYGVWGFVGLVIAVSELSAVFGDPPWPTISATVAHLEHLWSPTKMIVVALLVAGAVQLLTYPPRRTAYGTPYGRPYWRTPDTGRLTKSPDGLTTEIEPAAGYLAAALAVIAAATAVAVLLNGDTYVIGYVIYGLIAVALVIVPNALAFWFARELPFPTLFRTLDNLDNRWHPAVLIIWSGLAVLVVHLVAYPWP